MMKRRFREIEALVSRCGLTLADARVGGSGHIKARVRTSDGATQLVVFAATPSDRRADMNKEAMLRRIAQHREGRVG